MTPPDAPSPKPNPNPTPDVAQTIADLDARKEAERWEELRTRFVDPDNLGKLFAAPGSELAKAGFERLRFNTPGHEQQREQVIDMVRLLGGRIFDAFKKNVDEHQKITAETERELMELSQNFADFIGEMGDTFKLHEAKYSDEAKDDTLETRELLELKSFLENMMQLDVEEMVDMVIDMQDPGEFDASGREIRENHDFLGMLIEGSDAFEYESEHYSNNIEVFMRFALGEIPASNGKEKSKFRNFTESTLANEILRKLDFQQKRDLIVMMLKHGGNTEQECVKITRGFIQRAIMLGTISRREAMHIYEEAGKPDSPDRETIALLGSDFDEMTRMAVAGKEQLQDRMTDVVHQIDEMPKIKNAAEYFLTFNNFGAETIGRVGMLTALINGAMNICDRISAKGDDESWIVAGLEGVGDAMKNPYVLGGAALSAACSEVIYPWMKNLAYSPSGKEKKQVERYREQRFLREQADNHPELLDYYVDIYPALMARAQKNAERNDGVLDLGPDDVETVAMQQDKPIDAGKLGFPDKRLAAATIVRMFGITARVLEKKTQTQLESYLIDNKLWGVTDEEAIAHEESPQSSDT